MLIITPTVGAVDFGGIPANATTPPEGTAINEKLSEYYGIPTATGSDTYWHVGGWGWFNLKEMLNLPSESIMYDESPYALSSGGSSSSIPIPVSPIVLVAFVITVIILRRKI